MEYIRVRSNIGIAALNHHVAGGWRLWCVASYLDPKGAGYVDHSVLLEFLANQLGVPRQNFQRWLKEALSFGFFKRIIQKPHDKRYLLSGEASVAMRLGLSRIDRRYMLMRPRLLFRKGWRNRVWEGYLTANWNGKIISRSKITELSGVERHRQRRWEQNLNIEYAHNYWLMDKIKQPEQSLPFLFEANIPAIIYKDKLHIRLPDSRTLHKSISRLPFGQSRRINKQLKRWNALSKSGAGAKLPVCRLFYTDIHALGKKIKKTPADKLFYQRECLLRRHKHNVYTWKAIYKSPYDTFMRLFDT